MKVAKIYKITNSVTNKVYIGFTTGRVSTRMAKHRFDSKDISGHKSKLYNSMRKHGLGNFSIEWLYSSLDIPHTLSYMENYFITLFDSINSGYNISQGGAGNLGFSPSQETREKIRKANTGKKKTEEQRRKIGISKLGKSRPKHVIEAVRLANSRSYSVNGSIINNLAKYCRDNNLHYGNLKSALRDNRIYKGIKVKRVS